MTSVAVLFFEKKIMFATSYTHWRKSNLYSSHLNFLYHLVSTKA